MGEPSFQGHSPARPIRLEQLRGFVSPRGCVWVRSALGVVGFVRREAEAPDLQHPLPDTLHPSPVSTPPTLTIVASFGAASCWVRSAPGVVRFVRRRGRWVRSAPGSLGSFGAGGRWVRSAPRRARLRAAGKTGTIATSGGIPTTVASFSAREGRGRNGSGRRPLWLSTRCGLSKIGRGSDPSRFIIEGQGESRPGTRTNSTCSVQRWPRFPALAGRAARTHGRAERVPPPDRQAASGRGNLGRFAIRRRG